MDCIFPCPCAFHMDFSRTELNHFLTLCLMSLTVPFCHIMPGKYELILWFKMVVQERDIKKQNWFLKIPLNTIFIYFLCEPCYIWQLISVVTTTTTTTIFICTHSRLKINYNKKILEIKLEYWLPGITVGDSSARQLVDISIKWLLEQESMATIWLSEALNLVFNFMK